MIRDEFIKLLYSDDEYFNATYFEKKYMLNLTNFKELNMDIFEWYKLKNLSKVIDGDTYYHKNLKPAFVRWLDPRMGFNIDINAVKSLYKKGISYDYIN